MTRNVRLNSDLADRALDNTNFSLNELSTTKKTIWSSYFLTRFSEIPNIPASEARNDQPVQVERGELSPNSEITSMAQKLKGVYSLSGELAKQSTASYNRKFMAHDTYHGYVASAANSKFVAIIEDRQGDKFEYTFATDELPEQQRKGVDIGSSIVVHLGHEYRRGTRVNVAKLYLSSYETNAGRKEHMISKKLSAWNF